MYANMEGEPHTLAAGYNRTMKTEEKVEQSSSPASHAAASSLADSSEHRSGEKSIPTLSKPHARIESTHATSAASDVSSPAASSGAAAAEASIDLAPQPDEDRSACPWRAYLPLPGERVAALIGYLTRGLRKDLRCACSQTLSERTGLDWQLTAVRAAQLPWPWLKTADGDGSNSAQAARDPDTALAIVQSVEPLRAAMVSLDALLVGCGVGLGPDEDGHFLLPDNLSAVVQASPDTDKVSNLLDEGVIDIDECDVEEDDGWEEAEEAAAATPAAKSRLRSLQQLIKKPPERPRVPYPGDRSVVDLPYPPGVLEQWQAERQAHSLLGFVIKFEGRIRDILAAAPLSPSQLLVADPDLAARGIRLFRHVCKSDTVVGEKLMALLDFGSMHPLREAMEQLSLTARAMRVAINAHGWWSW